MIRRTSLARVSDARRAEKAEYDRARQAAFDRDKCQCQAARLVTEITCWGVLDPHHVFSRSRYPERRNDPDALLTVCRGHHDWIGNNPARARELGLLA